MPPKPLSENMVPGELLEANDTVRRWLLTGPGYVSDTDEQLLWSRAFGMFCSDTKSEMNLDLFKFCLKSGGFTVLQKGQQANGYTHYFNFPTAAVEPFEASSQSWRNYHQ